MREESKKWLDQALEDLKTSEDMLKTGHYYASAFWSQQVAEKSLEALLAEKGISVRTHDLLEIADIIEREVNIPLEEIREDLAKLTVHYTISRYPDVANGVPARLYSKSDAEDLLNRAKRVMEWVKQNLQ